MKIPEALGDAPASREPLPFEREASWQSTMGGTSKTIRVALIGCGTIGSLHARSVRESPFAELVACCDTVSSRVALAAQGSDAKVFDDVTAMLETTSPDAVLVATPDPLHAQPTLAALEAGCHVFCEKPLATTLEEAISMADSARRCDRHLAVDYNRRFGFGYRKAWELLSAGRVGRVTRAVLSVTDGYPLSAPASGSHAILYTLLTHHIDLLRWFCGEIEGVSADFGPPDDAGLVWDVSISFHFTGGAVGSLAAGWRSGQTRTAERMDLAGTRGALEVHDVQGRVRLLGLNPDHAEEFAPDPFLHKASFHDSLAAHVQDFLERLYQGEAPLISGWDGVRGLQIVEAAIESDKLGRRVSLPPEVGIHAGV
ncbi:MAG: Gfo/Idh/MocA family oxidoreductase [Armatimonadetes bacterium]|nr:Gfo/Idh/MocA family oxidoreductase [Armatimonadota bacterium]